MNPPEHDTYAAVSAAKAVQEANRAERIRQLATPAEIWRRQQAALTELAGLRPNSALEGNRGRRELDSREVSRRETGTASVSEAT